MIELDALSPRVRTPPPRPYTLPNQIVNLDALLIRDHGTYASISTIHNGPPQIQLPPLGAPARRLSSEWSRVQFSNKEDITRSPSGPFVIPPR